MIKFHISALHRVKQSLKQAGASLKLLRLQNSKLSSYTTVPSLSGAYTQHASFWDGQSGSATNVLDIMYSNVEWLQEVFANHIQDMSLQEYFSGESFDQIHSKKIVQANRDFRVFVPTRDSRPIDNLMYNTPVTVAEATMTLPALISAFQGDDSTPFAAANAWESAAKALKESMENLKSASSGLAGSAEGYSFDMAREAIDDVHKTGLTIAANTTAMAGSVRQFPVIRNSNLKALEAIQATTTLIPDPAERLLAEQAAITNFVSANLQPSLELVRPPVSNLGVPIVGHSGGGTLDATTVSAASAQPTVSHINGNTNAVAPASATAHGNQAASAAAHAPKPAPASAATQPAATPGGLHAPAHTPAPVQPAATTAPHTPGLAHTATTTTAQTPTITQHSGAATNASAPGQGGTGMADTNNLINAQERFANRGREAGRTGTLGNLNAPRDSTQLRAIGGGKTPGSSTGSGLPKANLRNVSTTAPRPSLPGSLSAPKFQALTGDGVHTNNPNANKGTAVAPHRAAEAKNGAGMRAGGNVASTALGRGVGHGGAGRGAKAGLRSASLKYNKQDRSYFRRLFLSGEDPLISGKKGRDRRKRDETARQTVRKVIR